MNPRHFLASCLTLLAASLLALSGCTKARLDSPEQIRAEVNRGIEALRTFNFEEAHGILGPVHPLLDQGTEQWTQATYALAIAAWHKAPPERAALEEAERLLQALIDADPDSELAANARLDLGRIAEVADFRDDVIDLPRARDYYAQVREAHPNTDASARASLYLAQSLAQTFEPEAIEEAIQILETEIARQSQDKWLGILGQYTAHLQAFYAFDTEAAIEPYLLAVEAGLPRAAVADESLWQLGLFAQDAGRDLLAAEVFTRIVDNYPRSIYGTVARERVIAIAAQHPEAGLRIPELSDVDLGR